jgi:hypothetical protein
MVSRKQTGRFRRRLDPKSDCRCSSNRRTSTARLRNSGKRRRSRLVPYLRPCRRRPVRLARSNRPARCRLVLQRRCRHRDRSNRLARWRRLVLRRRGRHRGRSRRRARWCRLVLRRRCRHRVRSSRLARWCRLVLRRRCCDFHRSTWRQLLQQARRHSPPRRRSFPSSRRCARRRLWLVAPSCWSRSTMGLRHFPGSLPGRGGSRQLRQRRP